MVNGRILELLKQPQNLKAEDLSLLDREISKFPYAQSLRALSLLGTHRFSQDAYRGRLAETAAYTTDKKILFQLVNGKTESGTTETAVETLTAANRFKAEEVPVREVPEAPKPVFINGERNRILFEGEEDFLERPAPVIDLESTLESGSIVITEPEASETRSEEEEEISNENSAGESGSTEEIVMETEDKQQTVENSAELSFHGMDEFMPEVKVTPPSKPALTAAPVKQLSRHEEEMQRLIAEVEAKMKASRKPKEIVEEEEITGNSEINFAENIPFEPEIKVSEEKGDMVSSENVQPEPTAWKPMSFFTTATSPIQREVPSETPKTEEERPVMNVSFFSDLVENIPQEKEEATANTESNVPQFINTWQSWLKLDKKAPKAEEIAIAAESETKIPAESVEETVSTEPENVKEAAIEKFIETEPKISRLKEEGNFTVKEKADDISHLMTETLANLYVEQRLYAKAIKAFEVLIKKHPEKKTHFEERISRIKELRQNK